ncbi:DPP IV N-terminal domain-containing protein, partial [Acinetobacter baumannii]
DIAKINAINNGVYNVAGTQMVYVFRGDLYWVDIKTNKTLRVTQTEEVESSPKFIMNDEWIAYSKNNNLFGWHTKTGITLQLTNITRSALAAA